MTGFGELRLAVRILLKTGSRLKKAGYNTGKLVQVKRTGVHARLAFALDERAPDFSIFLCQDMIKMPPADPELVTHPNGVKGIAGVALYEHLPEDFQYYIQTASGERRARSHSFGMDIKLPNTTLRILNADGMKTYYGETNVPSVRGLRAMAFDLAVENLAETEKTPDKKRDKVPKDRKPADC